MAVIVGRLIGEVTNINVDLVKYSQQADFRAHDCSTLDGEELVCPLNP